MTTDEHRAAHALLSAEAQGDLRRPLTGEEGTFLHGCLELMNAALSPKQRSRLLRLADERVPWHDARELTPQQVAALDALKHCRRLSSWELGFCTKARRTTKGLSPKQEARLFEIADERMPGWHARIGSLFLPTRRAGAA